MTKNDKQIMAKKYPKKIDRKIINKLWRKNDKEFDYWMTLSWD